MYPTGSPQFSPAGRDSLSSIQLGFNTSAFESEPPRRVGHMPGSVAPVDSIALKRHREDSSGTSRQG